MFRLLIRAGLILLVLVAVGFFGIGYWTRGTGRSAPAPPDRTGASERIDTTRARERGADIGEKAAVAAAAVEKSVDEGTLTAKITAKMVLDDTVKARTINVTTNNSTVTLKGTVKSRKEKDRAVQLARETDGVTAVSDQLVIEP
jgi:osmotically-inducible protein OsmY